MEIEDQSSIAQSATSDKPQISENPSASAKSSYGKRNWKKWLLIYLGIAVILYGGTYYFVLSKQTKSPYGEAYITPTLKPTRSPEGTENWKTYANKQIGITFKYPSTKLNLWNINENLSRRLYYDGEVDLEYQLSPVAHIAYINNPQQLSLEELDKKLILHTDVRGDLFPMLFSSNNKPVILGNASGYIQEKYFCEPTYCTRYIMPLKDKVIDIILFPNQSNTRDKILSTFRFE